MLIKSRLYINQCLAGSRVDAETTTILLIFNERWKIRGEKPEKSHHFLVGTVLPFYPKQAVPEIRARYRRFV